VFFARSAPWGDLAQRGRGFAVCLTFVFLAGCAGHAARTEGARAALDAHAPQKALERLNEALGVDGPQQVPDDASGDNALLLLDRAMVLQSLASLGSPDWQRLSKLSSRDLEVADKQIEILDFSRTSVDDIGRYLFSDATGPYKAPTYEKLMINTMNLMNYLARGDLGGGRIEARRLAVMQKFIRDSDDVGASLTGPGSYLAGFVFEKSGRFQEALRFYDEALQHGEFRSLHPAIVRLAAQASYRSPRIRTILEGRKEETPPEAANEDTSPALPGENEGATPPLRSEDDGTTPARPSEDEVHETASPSETASPNEAAASAGPTARTAPAEVLVVINFGRVPAKTAKRVPIGLALTWVSGALSPTDRARANRLAAQGLVTWVNYPELERPRGQYSTPGFALGGEWQRLEGALAVDREARRAWDAAKGAIIASAITRMVSRVVAGEATRRVSGGGILGTLLSLGTQAAMTAADTPDTRSWATLPARIAIGRVEVEPGTHHVDLVARGVRERHTLELEPGGWAVVVLTVLH
jgi:uncharacterized protein